MGTLKIALLVTAVLSCSPLLADRKSKTTCTLCFGRRLIVCKSCKGSGHAHCKKCKGTGRIKRGYKTVSCPTPHKKCGQCIAESFEKCPRCKGAGLIKGRLRRRKSTEQRIRDLVAPKRWAMIDFHQIVDLAAVETKDMLSAAKDKWWKPFAGKSALAMGRVQDIRNDEYGGKPAYLVVVKLEFFDKPTKQSLSIVPRYGIWSLDRKWTETLKRGDLVLVKMGFGDTFFSPSGSRVEPVGPVTGVKDLVIRLRLKKKRDAEDKEKTDRRAHLW